MLSIQPHVDWVIPRPEGATRLEYSYRSCHKTIKNQGLSLVSAACEELCSARLLEAELWGSIQQSLLWMVPFLLFVATGQKEPFAFTAQ